VRRVRQLGIEHPRTQLIDCVGDITHGGLSLSETPAWKDAKQKIEAESGSNVVQWHRDELSPEVRGPHATAPQQN
jgi:hypothetical protein